MSRELFSDAMSEVGEKYIMEAAAYKQKKKSPWRQWGMKAAGFLLILVMSGSLILAVNAEARAAFFGWFSQQYDSVHHYFFTGDKSAGELQDYELTWVPERFTYETEYEIAGGRGYIYSEENDDMLSFTYSTTTEDAGSALYIVEEEPIIEKVSVNGFPGDYYQATDGESSNCIVWQNDNNTIFYIAAYAEKEELLKMAESVIVKK